MSLKKCLRFLILEMLWICRWVFFFCDIFCRPTYFPMLFTSVPLCYNFLNWEYDVEFIFLEELDDLVTRNDNIRNKTWAK